MTAGHLTGTLPAEGRRGASAGGGRDASPAPAAGAAVRLQGVSRVHGRGARALLAVDSVSLDIAPSEVVCLLGASGSGKSTLLALVAGLDRPTTGSIEVVGGRAALMFQEAALLPWLSVEHNIELPMRLRGVGRERRAAEATRLLELVRLDGVGRRRPHELSGGMRQRVALARALAQGAELLLMDEPFAALDAITRDLLHEDLVRIQAATGVTVVFVTHNVREAVRLGDRVVLLSAHPGHVAETWMIDLPRPRRLDDTGSAALAGEITQRLSAEIASHGRR